MQKSQQTSKEVSENDNKGLNQAQEELIKGKNEPVQNEDITKKKTAEEKQKEIELKSKILNKPKELIEFDALSHFKENIANTDRNYLGPITENSYYCITCKHSECPKQLKDPNQKEHLLVKRKKCLFYDTQFFDDVDKKIKEALTYSQLKDNIKLCVTNSINSLKDELDKLKERKFQEIETFFEETDKYLLELKNRYLNVRQSIEDYYKINKKFFNIEIIKDTNIYPNKNLSQKKINLNSLLNQITLEDIETGKSNKDFENSIFLLNFEMMNLCETKNLEIIHLLKNLKNKIDSFNVKIQKELFENLALVSGFFEVGIKSEKIDDYYWDVVLRTKKYSEQIQQFREAIVEIYHNTGNLEKIKDLIDIFDSKLKKNNKIIFEQKYFKDNNDFNYRHTTGTTSTNEKNIRRRNTSGSHTRTNSKSKLYSSRGKSAGKLKKTNNDQKNDLSELIRNNIGTLTLSNDIGLLSLQRNKNDNAQSGKGGLASQILSSYSNLEPKKTTPNPVIQKMCTFQNCVPDDIILNQRVVERFFAYSISELYSKNFLMLDPENEGNYTQFNKDNIYLNKNLNKKDSFKNININNTNDKTGKNIINNKLKSNKKGNSSKKIKNMSLNISNRSVVGNTLNDKNNIMINNYKSNLNNNSNMFSLYNPKNMNNNNNNNNNNYGKLEPEKFESNQYNIKSVSYLSHYTNRYNSLKERAKPVVGSNQIQLFSPINQKMVKKPTTLNKDEHGYNLFPEGCRHILVEDNLYIVGGVNHVRLPISIVLVYNIVSGELKRLPDLNTTHSYHTLEYLENYDSLICVGGENSSSCEIMNLENKTWYKLPNLNIPRANCNIHFNNITGEIYVLFGIVGILSEKTNNYSDSIEVLLLNDLSQGWLKVDYYKTPGLNLKVNYCMTIPFTRNQLLIYGGSNMRSFRQNIFALFHMLRSECIKVDTQTMELIKLDEKKSRLVDLALTRLG